ncbi:hypothetical protein GCM10028777_37160 [Angustibacter speluncae]
MSREVMGTGSQDAAVAAPGRSDDHAQAPELSLTGDPVTPAVDRPTSSVRWLLAGARGRAAGAVVGAAVVAALVGAGATAAVLGAGADEPRVVAWLEFGDGGGFPGGDGISMVLNVVNAGRGEVVVDAVDLDAGPTPGAGAPAVGVVLDEPVRVAPGGHARHDVVVQADDCERGRRPAPGGDEGTLRVGVTGADARRTWVDASEVGAFPVTPDVLVQSVCDAGDLGPVRTQQMSVGDDGELVVTLRSTGPGPRVLEVVGPPGVRFTSEPSLPVTVPGRDDGSVTVAVRLVVDDCTSEVQDLQGAGQVRLVADEQDVYDFDFLLLHSWYVREVTRSCG